MTPEEEQLQQAQPSWVRTDQLAKDLYELKSTAYGASPGGDGRSADYPFSPLLQKVAPILTIPHNPSGSGGGDGINAETIPFVAPSNGAFGTVAVFADGPLQPL